MDPLSDVLSLIKPTDFGFRGLNAGGDWALFFASGESLRAFAIEAGTCWLSVDDGDAIPVGAGDLVLMPGRTAYRLASAPHVPPIDAHAVFAAFPAGTTGTLNGGGECLGVGGFFNFTGPHAELLLRALPPVIHVRAEATRSALGWLIRRLMEELRAPQLGGALVASHLAQTLLVEALRLHLAGPGPVSGWLASLADARLCAAVTAMHADPARRWSLAQLAQAAGMSWSSFAARFRQVVGEAPLEYLTRWRMLVAADMLSHRGATLASVAPAVGYESEGALGNAFKRVLGQSPRQYLHGAPGRPHRSGRSRRSSGRLSMVRPERPRLEGTPTQEALCRRS